MDAEFHRNHDAGCELMGRGTGVPESLCALADQIEAITGDSPGDALLASLGAVLLQRRADQAEMEELRRQLRDAEPATRGKSLARVRRKVYGHRLCPNSPDQMFLDIADELGTKAGLTLMVHRSSSIAKVPLGYPVTLRLEAID